MVGEEQFGEKAHRHQLAAQQQQAQRIDHRDFFVKVDRLQPPNAERETTHQPAR